MDVAHNPENKELKQKRGDVFMEIQKQIIDSSNTAPEIVIGLEEEVYKNLTAINDIVDRIIPIKFNNDDMSIALLADAYQELDKCLLKIKDNNPKTRNIISKRAEYEVQYANSKTVTSHEEKLWNEITPLINKLNRINSKK